MTRPDSTTCAQCGERFSVAPVGKVPRFCSDRCRKDSYRGVCRECGAPTTGGDGAARAPELCRQCHRKSRWTPDRIVAAIRRWASEHDGIPPRSLDWGNGTAVRHPDFTPDYPVCQVVRYHFGSFNNGLRAAGLTPHMERDANRFTPEVVTKICERLEHGEGTASVAESLGVSRANLRNSLRYRGISITPRTRAEQSARTTLFCELWLAGASAEEIAETLGGMKRHSVYEMARRLRKRGVDLPLRKAARRTT